MGRPQTITFSKGNYTVSYTGPLRDNHLQGVFDKPYHVNVTIPQEFDVRNPLLAGLSNGANVTRFSDNTTLVQWNRSYAFDLRFYDETREQTPVFFPAVHGDTHRRDGCDPLSHVTEEIRIIF